MSLLLFLLLAGAFVGYAFWVYLRAELPVPGARLLAAARGGALVLILALLFDPAIPSSRSSGPSSRRGWVLLDASRSMSAAGGGAWREAVRISDSLAADGWRVVPFGDDGAPRRTSPGLPEAPSGTRTRLAPALERAAESGVHRVTVVSDMRFQDRVEAGATLAGTPLDVTFRDVGSDVPNAGIASFVVRDVGRKGDSATAEVEVFGRGANDTLDLEVREENRLVLSRGVAAPAPGGVGRFTFRLPPAREEGWVRYRASVRPAGAPGASSDGTDAFSSDDHAVAYAHVGADRGGLVVVSLRPDWDARALSSVLEETTGLEAVGYLRVGPDRFALMGTAVQRRAPVDSAAVRRAAASARVLVVQGLDRATDAWGRSLAARARRVLVWPLDATAAGSLEVPATPALGGEWYASPEVPSSPLAADLSGADLRDLPPLTAVLPVADPAAGSVPLRLQLRGSGPFRPALLLRRPQGRREVVVLASGFWRWAARDGTARTAYRRLWSGVAGWLLAPDRESTSGQAGPERRVYGPGESVRWRIPGAGIDSARVFVLSTASAASAASAASGGSGGSGGSGRAAPAADTLLDTLLAAGPAVPSGSLPPGSYRYSIRMTRGSEEASAGPARGRFDVEDRTLEMLPPRAIPSGRVAEDVAAARTAGDSGGVTATGALGPNDAVGKGRPLRTSPWPYLLILGLICAEWVGRRRVGLR